MHRIIPLRQCVFLARRSHARTAWLMKITACLLLLACLQLNARGLHGQGKITINAKAASLETILKDIRKQTGYQYLFVDQWEQEAKKVDIFVTNATLEEVLDLCFKDQPFSYTIIKKMIVVKKKADLKALNENPPTIVNFKGHVTNELGEPLSGASITLKNGKKGTLTDEKGMFELKNLPANAILTVSYTGYQRKEIPLNGQSSLAIVLAVANSILDQVQVVAYGTTTKRLNTGNVTTVKSEDIEKQPVNNPLLALEGRVPGMFITQSSGLPGTAVKIQIRGQNSIANGNDPLYIIDGVPYTSQNLPFSIGLFLGSSGTNGQFTAGNPFSYINPADIESIDILKDADATAIYGSRGANGVILITTKKGKSGSTRANINVQSGWGKVPKKMQLLDTRQYLDMRYEAFRNNSAIPNPNADYDLTLWDTTRNTNWQKELIGGTAKYNDLQASLYGGNANTQYLIGAGYHKETTVFPGDFNDQKGSVHFNISNNSPDKKFKVILSGVYTVDNNRLSADDLTGQALQLPPDAPAMYKQDGSLNWEPNAIGTSTWQQNNPAATLLSRYKTLTKNLVSNAVLSYELIPHLQLRSSFGYSDMQTNGIQAIPLEVHDPSTWAYQQRNTYFTNGNIHSWIIEPQASYSKAIKKGEITVLAGATIQQNSSSGQQIYASGFNSDLVMEDIASATSITPNTSNSVYKYAAIFSRLNFNWNDEYLLNLTARRDGSSRFGPANQFHNFGAIGLGWVFSREQLIIRTIPILSFGKLRASYGTTGSDQVGNYTFMDLYNSSNRGVPYLGVVGIGPSRIFAPDLAWEETKKMEAGLELGFLKDRILFTSSFYHHRSSNQLLGYLLPAITGFTSVQKNMPAVVQNQGWEFEFRSVNIKSKDFQWTSSFNVSLNRNKLVSVANGLSAYYQQRIGHPLQSSFVYHFLGVDPISGLYQVADGHGNPSTNPNPSIDMTTLIDLTPKFYGGFQNSISYKGIQLDFLFQFTERPSSVQYLYNYIPGFFGSLSGSNQPVSVLDRWQKPGDVKPIQKFSQNYTVFNAWNNAQQSDQSYGDASYIRLKNMSLSCQFPDRWKKMLHLQNGRIYIQGQNLLTITKYQGLDPERSSTNLPPLRVVTFGLQITL